MIGMVRAGSVFRENQVERVPDLGPHLTEVRIGALTHQQHARAFHHGVPSLLFLPRAKVCLRYLSQCNKIFYAIQLLATANKKTHLGTT